MKTENFESNVRYLDPAYGLYIEAYLLAQIFWRNHFALKRIYLTKIVLGKHIEGKNEETAMLIKFQETLKQFAI